MIFIGHGESATNGLETGEQEVLRLEVLGNIITPCQSQVHLTLLLTSGFSGRLFLHAHEPHKHRFNGNNKAHKNNPRNVGGQSCYR